MDINTISAILASVLLFTIFCDSCAKQISSVNALTRHKRESYSRRHGVKRISDDGDKTFTKPALLVYEVRKDLAKFVLPIVKVSRELILHLNAEHAATDFLRFDAWIDHKEVFYDIKDKVIPIVKNV